MAAFCRLLCYNPATCTTLTFSATLTYYLLTSFSYSFSTFLPSSIPPFFLSSLILSFLVVLSPLFFLLQFTPLLLPSRSLPTSHRLSPPSLAPSLRSFPSATILSGQSGVTPNPAPPLRYTLRPFSPPQIVFTLRRSIDSSCVHFFLEII